MKNNYLNDAITFCHAIKILASKPDNLDTLENYLAQCFPLWLEKYGDTPRGIATELMSFAEMDRDI